MRRATGRALQLSLSPSLCAVHCHGSWDVGHLGSGGRHLASRVPSPLRLLSRQSGTRVVQQRLCIHDLSAREPAVPLTAFKV